MATSSTERPEIAAAAERVGRYRWVICALLFAATAINYVDRQMMGVLEPDYLRKEFHWTPGGYAQLVVYFQIAYAIGQARPVGTYVETFGTETVDPARISAAIAEIFDLRPRAIIDALDLKRPIYAKTAAHGHFGREDPDFTWERLDRVDELKAFFNA